MTDFSEMAEMAANKAGFLKKVDDIKERAELSAHYVIRHFRTKLDMITEECILSALYHLHVTIAETDREQRNLDTLAVALSDAISYLEKPSFSYVSYNAKNSELLIKQYVGMQMEIPDHVLMKFI